MIDRAVGSRTVGDIRRINSQNAKPPVLDANLDRRAKLAATDIFCHAIGQLEGRVLRPEPSKRNLNPVFEYSR